MKKDEIDYIHDLLAKLDAQLDTMNETLVRHDVNLANHMRRTELLEEALKPVIKHVDAVKGVGAFIGLVAVLVAIWEAVH